MKDVFNRKFVKIDSDETRALKRLIALIKASSHPFWRTIAVIVAIASVISAVFQVLNYCSR